MLSRRRIRLNGRREVDDPSVRYELKNQKPVDLLDLTSSLAAFGESYQDFVTDAGFDLEPGNVRFFVKDIRSGSIIADLASQAAQGSLTLQHVEAAAAFMANLNDIIQFFLGIGAPPTLREKPSKREADQVIKILEPVAKDGGSQLFLTVSNGDIHLHQHHYNSQQANAAQNSARRYLGPPIPTTEVRHDVLLRLHQVRGGVSSKVGDLGIIEEISRSPVKLSFASEETKRKILEQPFPFESIFVVDVEVKASEGKPALYRILAVKDAFQRS
jgi:hypothetical protein